MATVTVDIPDVLPANVAFGLNVAVIACAPEASDAVLNEAPPFWSASVPSGTPPSAKVTLPNGAPDAADTLAVNVSTVPAVHEPLDADNTVVVGMLVMVTLTGAEI